MADPAWKKNVNTLRWDGHKEPCLDKWQITQAGPVTLGCYGGNTTAGAKKNEDAAFIVANQSDCWTFAALCDAHGSSQSAQLALDLLEQINEEIIHCLSKPVSQAFPKLESLVLKTLLSSSSKQRMSSVKGETALLLCAQKDNFLWWLAIGDNLVYLFHPELAQLGQYALNQRHFFEWAGEVNALTLPVPCYSRGVSELRQGVNHIVLLTDGALEFGERRYENPKALYAFFAQDEASNPHAHRKAHTKILQDVHTGQGRDSATIISFSIDTGAYTASLPSA